ncbi:hypothetical protein JNUCC1_01616 [Lentibacillus sp. JNUCC-1]|uniref:ASCH domain-containing protein n=1 Tax=Lentibacillus sp. JNUCC-1 TaxID=2654513 RepID=UPI0012E95A82|nr:ASCH domain-containing protein [Lentibacillus sp. JNUCC-1]MUV37810.1 hypothetical protein [Lentibacillus sp. JNUCC-1]
MEHRMGLYDTPFNSIKSGRKKVEVRLNDEKRRQLKVGNTITFTHIPNSSKKLTVKVTELVAYPTFREMYEDIPASDLDATGCSIDEMVEQTYEIYTSEQEHEWGTLAIGVEMVKGK